MVKHKMKNGQLLPLKQRMSELELDKRSYRIRARRQMAMATGIVKSVTARWEAVLARGFWGKLKFAFRGR